MLIVLAKNARNVLTFTASRMVDEESPSKLGCVVMIGFVTHPGGATAK